MSPFKPGDLVRTLGTLRAARVLEVVDGARGIEVKVQFIDRAGGLAAFRARWLYRIQAAGGRANVPGPAASTAIGPRASATRSSEQKTSPRGVLPRLDAASPCAADGPSYEKSLEKRPFSKFSPTT